LGNENYTGSSETFYVNVTEDKVKPVIRLSPSNKARSVSSEKLDLSYVVSDDVRISNCSLILNGVVVATDSKVKKDTPQSFSRNFDKGNYSSNISCVDEASNTGYASLGVLVVEAAVASTSNATTPTYSSRGPDCNQTCLNLKYECGQQSVCGISTNCGSCASTKVCQNGKCITKAVSCIPECSGRSCGDDGCSGSCGECAQDQLCEAGLCKAKEVIVAPKEVAPSSNLLVYFGLGILGLLIISGIVVFFVVFYPKLMVKKPQTLNQVAEEETKLPKELVDGAKKLIVEYRKLKFDDAKIKSMFIQQGWTEKQINKIL
jgi:hypothetical protein